MIIKPILPLYVLIPLAVFVAIIGVICIIKKKYRNLSSLRRILLFVFLLITLLRPSLIGGESEQATTNATLFFVIDNTNSMAVEDMNKKPRLDALKADVEKIIKTFPGAHYSVYIQDNLTYTLLPVTTDTNAVISGIRALESKYYFTASTTDLNDLLAYADMGIGKYANSHKDSQNIVIFMSDGENTKNPDVQADSGLFKNVSAGVVIGYGSEEGGKVPRVPDPRYATKYENDSKYASYLSCPGGSDCVSKIDEKYLKQVADKNNFEYMRSSDKVGRALAEDLKKNISAKVDINYSKKINSYIELYWIFALCVLILLLWEFYSCFGVILSEYEVNKK